MRVLLGQVLDAAHPHPTVCEDCGQETYLGDRQQALEARHEPDLHVRCQACDVALGNLRVLR